MNDKKNEAKSKHRYSEKELIERLTPYLAHADVMEGLTLSNEEFERIMDKIENPPEHNPQLKALLEKKSPWES